MDTRKITGKLSAIAISILLASCGGGGGDGYFGNNDSTGSGSGTDTGTDTKQAVNVSAISLFDINNVSTQTITASGVTAKVRVTGASGNGISGALVTFAGSGVVFGTSNGAVLTNADGEASISIKPESSSDTGSYQLTASASFNDQIVTSAGYSYSLQAANISFENMVVASSSLDSGASTIITLKTQDAATKNNQNNVTVNFRTSCGSFDNNSVVSSNQGDVAVTYKSIDENGKLCEGPQTIDALGSDASVSKQVQVQIAAIAANSLVYSTANKVNLVTRNSGSASSGNIEFSVFANGVPAINQDVNIELAKGPSDLSFITDGNRTTKTVRSDASGKVVVNLYPGNLPGPVEIKASLAKNTNIFVLSKDVAVASGRVTQSGLSLSMSKVALLGGTDGDTSTIVARMVDRVGNAVPDGTVISFISEGGSVTPNCGTTNGACSVTLTTQNPRPLDDRVTVLAFVEGDKSYTDIDNDNMYTAGIDKLIQNIGDFFLDDNENNQKDEGEFKYVRGASGTACVASTIDQPNINNTCDDKLDAVLRKQLRFAFSDDTPTFVALSGINTSMTKATVGTFTFQMFGNSLKTVPMPSGTTISAVAKDNTDNEQTCEAEVVSGSVTVPNTMNLLLPSTFPSTSNVAVTYSVRVLDKCTVGDEIRITVTAPNGTIYKPLINIVKSY